MHASLIATPKDFRRMSCPANWWSFECGSFLGCCRADPCQFLDNIDPCNAAVIASGGGSDDDDGDEPNTTSKATSTQRLTRTLTRTLTPTSTEDSETSATDEAEPSTTDDTEPSTETFTIDEPETSTSEPESTTAPAPSSLPNTDASTTSDGTTLSTSIIGTTSSAGNATAITQTIPAPTSTSSTQPDNGGAPLPATTIAAVSVGGTVGGIALLLLLFWFIRRRRLSRRMSSVRGGSPRPLPTSDEKSMKSQSQSTANDTAAGPDVFAEFGGRVQRHQGQHNPHVSQDVKQDEGWPLCSPHPSEERPMQPVAERYTGPPQLELDSRPVYVELDSAETARVGVDAGDIPQSPSTLSTISRRHSPLNNMQQIHPSPLTPGFPGTQMAIQNRMSEPAGGVDVVDPNHHRDSANAPRDAPRATLNATVDERVNNLYANSWAQGLPSK
ncbi:hypothetical protein F5Y19DRAFT_485138 [Xylariaceae sp. FL1651]|nr:hypothetical protein F5Y19DRAFT_485138 [Xylariaceae sp. FL1651]